MKTLFRIFPLIMLIMLSTALAHAETTTMKFSDPSKPGTLMVTGNGNVTVTGYNGSDVIIESETVTDTNENGKENEKAVENEQNERARGLRRIAGSSVNVVNDKENNVIQITRSIQHESNVRVRVPFNTTFTTGHSGRNGSGDIFSGENFERSIQSIVVNSVFTGLGGGILEGNITITNLTGDIDVSTVEGNITLSDISGALLVNTVDGDIEAVYKAGASIKQIALSTVDGFIDLTLPSSTKADVKIKTVDGDVLTDFDIEMIPISTEERSTGNDKMVGLRFGPQMGNSIYGKINGGGPEIRLSSIDSDIYFRKAK